MKAKFFFLGLCALALAACSIDEVSQVNDTNAIQFKTTVATRAAATTTNSISDFSVWAWNGSVEFMDGVVATRNGNSSTFTTSPLYFWPTGTVDFYAITPSAKLFGIESGEEYAYFGGELNDSDDAGWSYTGYVGQASIANGDISIDVTVPHDAGDQIDLCYAVAKEQTSGSVPMNFRHIFSQLAFKALNTNEEMTIKIDGVSVCSVFMQGTYSLPTVSTSGNLASPDLGTGGIADSQGAWSETLTHKARFNAGISNTTLEGVSEEAEDITSDPLMVLPQQVEEWDVYTDPTDTELGSYIRIACNISENGSQLWPNSVEEDESDNLYTKDGVEYAEIAIPVEADWAEGYRYTYTLIFGEGAGYYPPDDPNADYDGTPILYPITFTVTVDEFQDAVAEEEGQYDVTTDTKAVVKTAADLAGAVEHKYSPIEIAADITLEGYLEFDYDCELTIDAGCTLTGPDGTEDCHVDTEEVDGINDIYYTTIIHVNGGNLTIYGEGTVATGGTNDSDFTCAILVEDGTVTIYGGTYKGSSWNGDTNSNYVRSAVYCSDNGYAYIYGGDFYAGSSTHPSAYAGTDGYAWVLNCKNSAYQEGTANIYCYGGTYNDGFDPANPHTDDTGSGGDPYSYCADGYSTVYDETTDCYTVVYTKVTSATDLEALIAAGASEITVTEDIVLTDQIRVGSDLVLNLEANLTKDSFENGANTEQNFFFWVGGGATLTINASNDVVMSSGGVNGNDADDWVGCIQVGGNSGSEITTTGHLIINGGTYNGGVWDSSENYNSVATIYLLGGDVTVYDGIFTGGLSNSFKSYGYKADLKDYGENGLTECIFNIYDNSRTDPNDAWIYVYGGQFRNFDPSCNAVEGANTNFVVDGYKATKGEEDADGNIWFTVTADD